VLEVDGTPITANAGLIKKVMFPAEAVAAGQSSSRTWCTSPWPIPILLAALLAFMLFRQGSRSRSTSSSCRSFMLVQSNLRGRDCHDRLLGVRALSRPLRDLMTNLIQLGFFITARSSIPSSASNPARSRALLRLKPHDVVRPWRIRTSSTTVIVPALADSLLMVVYAAASLGRRPCFRVRPAAGHAGGKQYEKAERSKG